MLVPSGGGGRWHRWHVFLSTLFLGSLHGGRRTAMTFGKVLGPGIHFTVGMGTYTVTVRSGQVPEVMVL